MFGLVSLDNRFGIDFPILCDSALLLVEGNGFVNWNYQGILDDGLNIQVEVLEATT